MAVKVVFLCSIIISCAFAQDFGPFKVIDAFNKLANLTYDISTETKLQFKVACDTFNHKICKDKVFRLYKHIKYNQFKTLTNTCYNKNMQLFLEFKDLVKDINNSITMDDIVFMRYHIIIFLKNACENPLITNNRLLALYK